MEIRTKKGRPIRDLTGQRFGKLTPIEVDKVVNHRVYWICQCECGRTKSILGGSLTNGSAKSCGCASAAFSKKTKAENRTRQEATRAQLVRNIRERFDDDWMFAEQGSNLKRKIRNANGDWI